MLSVCQRKVRDDKLEYIFGNKKDIFLISSFTMHNYLSVLYFIKKIIE
jgi:hypothetical protein